MQTQQRAEPRSHRLLVITNGNFFAKIILDGLFDAYAESIIGAFIVTGDYKGRVGLQSLWSVGRVTAFPYLIYKLATILFFKLMRVMKRDQAWDVEASATAKRIPIWHVTSINRPELISRIDGLQPDVIISVSCPQRIPEHILNLSSIGNINIHSSLLPTYAGLAPYYWVLANGEKRTGTTVHVMTPKFDKGNVLSQHSIEIEDRESAFHLFLRLAVLGKHALLEGLERILKGDQGTPQDPSRHTYFSNPSFASYLALKKRGHVLIRIAELADAIRQGGKARCSDIPGLVLQ